MKKMITMLSLGILIAGSSFAQTAPRKDGRFRSQQEGERARGQRETRGQQNERKSPEQMATDRTARLDKQLDLSKSQEKKVHALFLQQSQEMQQNRANRQNGQKRDSQGRDSQNKDFRKEDHGKYDAELKKILNKKQYAKLESDRQEMRSRLDARGQKRAQDFKGKSQRHRQDS